MSSESSSSDEEVDFNVYRKEFESEEHFQLRKAFLIAYWDQIESEEEILCCAQLFANIEFLGCRYSNEIMSKISKMSSEVPEIVNYRLSRKNKLKRTFIQASEMRKFKIKPKVKSSTSEDPVKPQQQVNNSFIQFVPMRSNNNDHQQQQVNNNFIQFVPMKSNNDHQQQDFIQLEPEVDKRMNMRDFQEKRKEEQQCAIQKHLNTYVKCELNADKIIDSDEEEIITDSGWDPSEINSWKDGIKKELNKPKRPLVALSNSQKTDNLRSLLRDVIIFDNGDENDMNFILNKTTSSMSKSGKLEMKYDAESKQYLYIFNNQIIGQGSGDSRKIAKKAADEDFIKTLKANCYTIRSKLKFFSIEDVVQKNSSNNAVTSSSSYQENQIQDNNLGFKMLKSLGWQGGSLGTTGNGIIDPINLEIKIGRKGLGSDIEKFDIKYFRNLLQNFKHNRVEYDLIFSPDFTKEERAQIHQIAGQLNLRTKSYGNGSSRHLVISSRLSPLVLRQKLLEGDKYLTEKFDIIPPPFKKKAKVKLLK